MKRLNESENLKKIYKATILLIKESKQVKIREGKKRKMISYGLLATISEKFTVVDFNILVINLITAVILVLAGIFLGKFIRFLGRKAIEQSSIARTAKKNYIELFLNVIKWCVYILFVSLALDQLGIPQLTSWLTSILVVIPALVGALILIAVGYVIAVYLKDLIEESDIVRKEILSMILFYFILYIFMIFAIRTALIGQDKSTVNTIIIIFTAVISAALAYYHVRKK